MITLHVCVGSACHIKGAYSIISILQNLIEEKGLGSEVTIKAALCLGNCAGAVSMRVDDSEVISVSRENIEEIFERIIREKLRKTGEKEV